MNGNINEFKVRAGLRQGCVLPITLSLIINSAVKELKEDRCGVECRDEIVSGLLFADDICLVASDVTIQLHNLKKWLHKTQCTIHNLCQVATLYTAQKDYSSYIYIYIYIYISINQSINQ